MIRELQDRWILDVKKARVVRVSAGNDVLSIDLDEDVDILIKGAAVRLLDATEVSLAHASPMDVSDIGVLRGLRVASAVAFKSGGLRVVFFPGYHLQIAPDHAGVVRVRSGVKFEWTGSGGRGSMVSPVAGG